MKDLTYDEVSAILKGGDLYGEINQPLYDIKYMANVVYDITITCGDWKHEHAYLDALMREHGYIKTHEKLIHDEYTDDGDDCYSATHRFIYQPYYELFNGKIA